MALDSRNRRRLFKRDVTVEVLDLIDGSVATQYDGDIFKLAKAPASNRKANTSCRNGHDGKKTKKPINEPPAIPGEKGTKIKRTRKRNLLIASKKCLRGVTFSPS